MSIFTCKPDGESLVSRCTNGIIVLRNIISDQIVKECRDFIDKYSNEVCDYDSLNNIKARYVVLESLDNEDAIKMKKDISQVLLNIKRELKKYIFTSFISCEAIELRKISGPTRIHCDGITGGDQYAIGEYDDDDGTQNVAFGKHNFRIFSLIIALNNDYEGGAIRFPSQNTIIKLRAGEALIFPPYWTHPHESDELNGTYRYTLTTWLTGMTESYTEPQVSDCH
tara:strand:- start:61 stop:735 length:675 start_codon:yes stop_codon:yes gene_type:complete